MRLAFYCPTKPRNVSQAWGIYNPAYRQFGFSRHNGTDLLPSPDKKLHWPVQNCCVYDTDWGDSTGFRIKANTLDYYDFPDGKRARVNIIMMHLEAKSPVPVGSVINVGDFVGFTGNTGFSTGPHTHVMGRRIDTGGNLMDQNGADNSFDLFEYWTGFAARDYGAVLTTYQTLSGVLSKLASALSSRRAP